MGAREEVRGLQCKLESLCGTHRIRGIASITVCVCSPRLEKQRQEDPRLALLATHSSRVGKLHIRGTAVSNSNVEISSGH